MKEYDETTVEVGDIVEYKNLLQPPSYRQGKVASIRDKVASINPVSLNPNTGTAFLDIVVTRHLHAVRKLRIEELI